MSRSPVSRATESGQARWIVTGLLVLAVTGCVAVAAGRYGKTESGYQNFRLGPERELQDSGTNHQTMTEAQVVAAWGAPDERSIEGECTVLRYETGTAWSGGGVFIGFFPIPAVAPTGTYYNRIYLRDGVAVGAVKEFGTVISASGVGCGSSDCGSVAEQNTFAPDAATKDVDSWCAAGRASIAETDSVRVAL